MSEPRHEIIVKQDYGGRLILQQTREGKQCRIIVSAAQLKEILQYLTEIAPPGDSSYMIHGDVTDIFIRVFGESDSFTIARDDSKLVGSRSIDQLLRYT